MNDDIPSVRHFPVSNGEMRKPRRQEVKKVKVIATSDLHGLLDGLPEICSAQKPDVLVIAGDMHPALIWEDPDSWFRSRFFSFVASLPCEVVAVPGNHDFWLAAHASDMESIAPKNFHLLIDSEVSVCGLRFYGTPWVPWISGRWCFEDKDENLKDRFALIPKGVDILVSHSPPKFPRSNLDVSTQHDERYWRHFGSDSLSAAIVRAKPRYCFCGHIHSGDHGEFKAPCGTRIFNVSRVNEQYNVHYAPVFLEIPAKPSKEGASTTSKLNMNTKGE